jgi:serine/threonine protein kinase
VKDSKWKIADFGLSREGTSKRQVDTIDVVGTASYRAPELLEERSTFTSKVDVFALGCTFYELVTRQKAFDNDIHVYEYGCRDGNWPEDPCDFLPIDDMRSRALVLAVIEAMIRKKP